MPLSANLFRLKFSIQKHAGSRVATPAGGAGGPSPLQKKKKNFFGDFDLADEFSKSIFLFF